MDQETMKQFAELLAANNEAIFARIGDVEKRVDSVSTELGGRIDSVNTELSGRIDSVSTELGRRIDSVSTELGGRIDGVETQLHALDTKAQGQDEKFEAVLEYIRSEGERTRSEIQAYIENTTNKRIEVLFDGYTGTQERMSILQQEVDSLKTRMQQLEDLVKSLAS